MQASCVHSARSVVVAASVSMSGSAVSARSVVVAASVSMGGSAVSARSVAVAASVSMGGSAVGARSVVVAASVSMGGLAVSARSVSLSFPRHPTHILSTRPAHPHCGSALLQKKALALPTHMATAASDSHMNMQAYSGLATVQKSDPAYELAATNSRAKRASVA